MRFALAILIAALQDPKWLTPATLTNPEALWEVRNSFMLIHLLALLSQCNHALSQYLGWPAGPRAVQDSILNGHRPWEGGDIPWDYNSWAHEPRSVDGPIYR